MGATIAGQVLSGWWIRAFLLLTLCAACSNLERPFVCHASSQCQSNGETGVCESNGSCSFADAACPSGRRYAALSQSPMACVDVPPPIIISNPVANANVSGLLTVTTVVDSALTFSAVDFYLDDQYLGFDHIAPYTYVIDTRAIAPGPHTIGVLAYNAAMHFPMVTHAVNVGQASIKAGIGFIDHSQLAYPQAAIDFYGAHADLLVAQFHPAVRPAVTAIKAKRPTAQIYAYRLYVNRVDTYHGIGQFADYEVQGEAWFLHAKDGQLPSAGNRISDADQGNPDSYYFNIGNPELREYVAKKLVAELADSPYDGVFLDNIMGFSASVAPHFRGKQFQEYATASEFNRATIGYVEVIRTHFDVHNAMHPHHLDILVNSAGYQDDLDSAKRLNSSATQLSEEFGGTVRYDPMTRYATGARWERQIEIAEDAATKARGFFAITQYSLASPADAWTDIIWGQALVLLAGNASAPFVFSPMPDSFSYDYAHNRSIYDDYALVFDLDLGAPLGKRYAVAGGAWRRDFAKGIVVVNPTETNLGNLSLGASYHDLETGASVSAITLGPSTARILQAN